MTGSSSFWFAESGSFYNGVATQSLRFNRSSSSSGSFLSRTFSTPTNNQVWTVSFWLKRGKHSTEQAIFGDDSGDEEIKFKSTNELRVRSGSNLSLSTDDKLFRDLTAWYHILVQFKFNDSTQADRAKLFVNGERIAAGSFDPETYPSNTTTASLINVGSSSTKIGHKSSKNAPFDGYLSDFYFIDGQALTPDSFTQNKNGVLIPKGYSGTYGNNGFRLQFSNTSVGSGSSSTVGADTSGNSNHFDTANVVAGDCNILDCPENNFATMFKEQQGGTTSTNMTLDQGNLRFTHSVSGQWQGHKGTFPVKSGKWYYEVQIATRPTHTTQNYGIGWFKTDVYNAYYYTLAGNLAFGAYGNNATTYKDTATTTYGTLADADGEVYQVAVDFDNSKIWFGLEGTFMASGDPANGSNPSISSFDAGYYVPLMSSYAYGSPLGQWIYNFGQDGTFAGTKTAQGYKDINGNGNFLFPVPSGFLALCNDNRPEPDIGPNSETQAVDHFGILTYTGDDTDNRAIVSGGTGIGGEINFTPDWLWHKARNSGSNFHFLYDSTRGVDKVLTTVDTSSEVTSTTDLDSFDANGFTVDDESGNRDLNASAHTYVTWLWKANGGTTSSNEDGTITSTVQANTTAGFSIVTYTGDGTNNRSVGHGLSSPDVAIIKSRTGSGRSWVVTHPKMTGSYKAMKFESTNAELEDTSFYIDIGSSTLGLAPAGTVNSSLNENAKTFVAYVFKEIEGYSKFGQYTGNASSAGPYIYLGFRPKLVILRSLSGSRNWLMYDSVRDPYNDGASQYLYVNLDDAEPSDGRVDFTSNGFKQRSPSGYNSDNASGETYIYFAWAEQPFKYSNAR